MVKWFCSFTLRFNNFINRDKNNQKLKLYRLPLKYHTHSQYKKSFWRDGFKWKNGHIFVAHQISGVKNGMGHIPDISVSSDQFGKIKQNYLASQSVLNKYKTPSKIYN